MTSRTPRTYRPRPKTKVRLPPLTTTTITTTPLAFFPLGAILVLNTQKGVRGTGLRCSVSLALLLALGANMAAL